MGLYASGPQQASFNGDSAEIATQPGQWSINSTPAAGAQATISRAAVVGVRHVCTGVEITIAAGATAQTPITAVLRDGATGAGTVLSSWALSAPVSQSAAVFPTALNIVGSPNTAMTVEFTVAGVAASQECVSLHGYDVTGA